MPMLKPQPVLCILAAALCAGQADASFFRHFGQAESFVRALEFKHRLRVCNAYPYSAAIDVYRSSTERLTGSSPMQYKACRDFSAPLMSGDKLEFKVGDAIAGTFAVSDLPNNDAVLLLVIHRHDAVSTAVSFESHVFANLDNAQVAILDTYKGKTTSSPRIVDIKEAEDKNARSEELRFDSVVAVNPGVYNVELTGKDGFAVQTGKLVALDRESYVVIRTGVEAEQGPSYPQELIVYPESDPFYLHSAAMSATSPMTFLMLVLAAISAWQCW